MAYDEGLFVFFVCLFFHLKRSTRKFCSLTNITTFHHCFAHVYVYLSDIDRLLLLLKKGRNIGVNAFQSYSFGASCRYEWRYKIKKIPLRISFQMKICNRRHELNNTADSSIPCNCGFRIFRYGYIQTCNGVLMHPGKVGSRWFVILMYNSWYFSRQRFFTRTIMALVEAQSRFLKFEARYKSSMIIGNLWW